MITNGLLALAASVVLAFVIEWALLTMLIPALRDSQKAVVSNYRGAPVAYGLGAVWIIFSVGYLLFSILPATVSTDFLLFPYRAALPLILIALGVGLVDDAFGTGDSRGFSGHIRRLAKGKLTTGGLKLISVSAASFAFAWVLFGITGSFTQDSFSFVRLGYALLAGAGIALTGNFMNLMDLRPARASKVYIVLAVFSVVLILLRTGLAAFALPADPGPALIALLILINLIWLCGPILATFFFDAREKAMLGDAGSNAMGVLLGAFIIVHISSSWWLIGIYTALMLALNVLSEKVSFSRVIEHNKVLSRLDNLGRLNPSDSGLERELPSTFITDSEELPVGDFARHTIHEGSAQEESTKIYGD